ncbi:hypothetical protein [Clostridium perfringens]|uniref:YobI family P-loop NTPase n=1 Tax=Clostridium perfringens TaxID=1502 RepID=UPI0024BC1E35|nr:hypothetical protein [Clostridium perfringens]
MNRIMKFFINSLKFIVRKLDIIIQQEENKNPDIEILSPIKSKEKNDKYLELLEKAIKHNDVYNICLSGDYGSGKSSIIESFKLNYPQYRYLNISLANFNVETLNDNENLLEKAIVKQLFYKTNHKKIPSSRFTKIRDISFKDVFFYLIIFLGIVSPIILLNLNDWIDILDKRLNSLNNIIPLGILNLFILLLLVLISLVSLIYIISKIFNKISFIVGIKKEIFEFSVQPKNEKINAFDKYIDELIYFFKRNDYDVIFFEDLDRFNEIEIFTKLRDLNRLLNDSEEVFLHKKHKRKIKFIYAIKDSIFSNGSNEKIENRNSEEIKNDNNEKIKNMSDFKEIKSENYILDLSIGKNRTKFFDYIIPVIPNMDANNSYTDLKKRFSDNKIKIEDEFISDITIFINDKRLLTNTLNEFLLYKDKLTHLKEDEYKYLFSIILYKNIYPVDFLDLTNEKGFLYEIINSKRLYLQEKLVNLDTKIKEIEEKIEYLNNVLTKDEDDLLNFVLGILIRDGYNKIGGRELEYYSLSDIKDIMEKKDNFYTNKGWRYSSDIFTEKVKIKINEKENLVKNNEFSEKNKLKKELFKLKIQRKECLEKNISDLILDNTLNIDFGKNKLIKVLLIKGYINERYNNYISYFREGEINFKELEFIQSVISRNSIPIDYELNNIDKIIKRIDIKDLGSEYILNLYLIEYLIKYKHKFDKFKYNKIINQFNKINDSKIDFLEKFSEFNIEVYGKLIKEIAVNNKELFTKLCFNNKSYDFKKLNFEVFINQLLVNELLEQNINSVLKEYILNEENIISFDSVQENKSKFIDLINNLDIKFKKLNLENSKIEYNEEEGINFTINSKNRYEINRNMIDYVYNFNDESNSLSKNVNYWMIKDSNNENMKNYINENINIYIKDIFLNRDYIELDKNYMGNEKSKHIIELLNFESLDKSLQIEIIEQKNFIIDNISEIKNEIILDKLLYNNRINITWENLNFYFNKRGLNDYLIDFINSESNMDNLKNKIISKEIIDSCFNLKCRILLEKKLKDDSIKDIKCLFFEPIDNIDLSNISEERLELLINLNYITLNTKIYESIKDKNNSFLLIIKNLNIYLDNYSEYYFKENDVKEIFESQSITKKEKLKVLETLSDSEINLKANYKIIGDLILEEDNPNFEQLKEQIIAVYFKEIKENINVMSVEEIKVILSKLRESYKGFNVLKSGSFKVNIDSNLNKEFLKLLEDKGVISSSTYLNNYEVRINRKGNKK